MRLQQQVEDLVATIHAMERGRLGRLAAVTLAVPESMGAEPLAVAVRDALAASGTEDVEVAARGTSGALRVLSVEFSPTRANR